MKKITKKLAVFSTAGMLTVGMGVAPMCVFAAEPTGNITLSNSASSNVSIDGKEFKAYKLFDLTYNATESSYAYTINSNYSNFFDSTEFTNAFTSGEITGASTEAEKIAFVQGLSGSAADLQKFAKAVKAYSDTNTITPTAVTASDETATFSGLEYGYYLFTGESKPNAGADTDTVMTACMLDTIDGTNPTINIKVGAPTLEKKIVKEDVEMDASSENIGDNVTFRIKSKVPDMTGYTAYTFTVTDTLSKGFVSPDDATVSVKIGSTTLTKDTDYTYAAVADGDNTKLTFTFLNFIDRMETAGTDITIEYQAKVDTDAVIGTAGNPNTAKLTYSNDPNASGAGTTNDTVEDTVKVYSYKLQVYKYTENDESVQTALSGAEFELYTDAACTAGNKVKITGNAADGYKVSTDGSDVLISDSNGNIDLQGLEEGTYYLKETKAPEGYNLLDAPIELKIDPTDDYTGLKTPAAGAKYELIASAGAGVATGEGIKANILNSKGDKLPSTGGMGTTWIYICGSILIVGAVTSVSVRSLAKKKSK